MNLIQLLAIAILFSFTLPSMAHEGHAHHALSDMAVSLAADTQGKLWRAQVRQGRVQVSYSSDGGNHFSETVPANSIPMQVAANDEARPKIVVANNGHVYVSWTASLKTAHAGYIWFARSTDHGNSFESPFIVHKDRAEISHRYEALQVAPDGTITVLWLDKREFFAAKAAGRPYEGAAIYYAKSTDQGQSFQPEQKLIDSGCDCCRLATAMQPNGTLGVLWRHVFSDGERDHAMAELNTNSQPTMVRASFGHWKVDGCPHHGAAVAYGEGFGYHLAYFEGAGNKPGLRIARMDSQAWVTSPPKRFGDASRHAGHPALASQGDQVWLAWREQSAHGMEIWYMRSADGGKEWTAANKLLSAEGKLDYPQWLLIKGQMILCANSQRGLLCSTSQP